MGESFDGSSIAGDEMLMPLISSCNIACGQHSGDSQTRKRSIALAVRNGVSVGAHPSYPDAEYFGRRYMDLHGKALVTVFMEQIDIIALELQNHNEKLHHIKPHGALYHHLMKHEKDAFAIAEEVASRYHDSILYGLPSSEWQRAAEKFNLNYAREAFADRRYLPDGQLQPRSEKGSVLDVSESLDQIREMLINKRVRATDGTFFSVIPNTICVHSDSPDCLSILKAIHEFLRSENMQLSSSW